MFRTWLPSLTFVYCISALYAPLASAQTETEWNKVIEAAKGEGNVTVYSAVTGAPQPKAIAKLFEDKYGIRVEILEGRPAEIHERIRMEAGANKAIGDITLNGSTTVALLRSQGLIAPLPRVPNASKVVIPVSSPDELMLFVNAYGIVANTAAVKKEDRPRSWLDLLDHKWKGKILANDPATTGAAATTFSVLLDKFGEDYHRKYAKQDLSINLQTRDNPRRVARGEFAIFAPFTLTDMGALEGLPLEPIVPSEGAVYTPFSLSALKGSPHPNAARLLMNFFLEDEAQLIYARSGYPIAIGGLVDRVPDEKKWSVTAKLLGSADLTKQEERLKLAGQIYHNKQ